MCVCSMREVWVTFREQVLVSAFTLSRHIEQHCTNTHKGGIREIERYRVCVLERGNT